MSKKEQRLSPRAKELLRVANKIFKGNEDFYGEANANDLAQRYLVSQGTEGLTPYDKRKIGREILHRNDRSTTLDRPYKTYDNSEIMETYGLTTDITFGRKDFGHRPERKKRGKFPYYDKILEFGFDLKKAHPVLYKLLYKDKKPVKAAEVMCKMGHVNEGISLLMCEASRQCAPYTHITDPNLAHTNPNLGMSLVQQAKRLRDMYRNDPKVEKKAEFYSKWFNDLESKLRKEQKDAQKRSDSIILSHLIRITIIGVLGGIFFLSSNITGNAIADMTTKTTSFLGAGLLIVGLVAGFFWLKGRKLKHKK